MQLKEYVKPVMGQKNYVRIKVTTRQPKTEFYSLMDDGTIKIRLKAVPENGKANDELIRFMSSELGIPKDAFEIISGATDTIKLVRISI